ncbi:hypothetical protein HanXRQr2_Chr16g0754571 [Helianthus annuus]|uniref:Uncharacterized protein n=1 Tax=Helianthus annuus TaxID=4232 RepID=A0A9K3DS92_HELAN|nr:hypothetical protein HanXRQr2_Chr16g0754571 [Helianthus annuus]KAJ0821692.1 hypothetical protein HanPSC8_Chr16g0723231 [Helianthus annuus]
MGSPGGTIMSRLSCRLTTPITLTVLPSLIYPSLRRISRSSLERLRSASHSKNLGDNSRFSFVISTTVASLTNGATLAPYPAFTRALNPDRMSDM